MRIYLSGPMRGYPESNYPQFNAAAADLRKVGHFVFNPAEIAEERDGATAKDYLPTDLAWIVGHAEAVAVLPKWDQSKGAVTEAALALACGLKVFTVQYSEAAQMWVLWHKIYGLTVTPRFDFAGTP